MSRIGKRPIKMDADVKVEILDRSFNVSFKEKQLTVPLNKNLKAKASDSQILISREKDTKDIRALHGLTTRLLNNAISDIKNGFKKELTFKGTGYRAKVEGNKIILGMGYSHDIAIDIPENIEITIVKNSIVITGINRERVGEIAAKIREVRPPEVYKGKGIKYSSENIKKKAGKAAQSAGKA